MLEFLKQFVLTLKIYAEIKRTIDNKQFTKQTKQKHFKTKTKHIK